MAAAALDGLEPTASPLSENDREAIRLRALELLHSEIDFIPNPEFRSAEVLRDQLVEQTLRGGQAPSAAPADLPAHLRRICESELLTHEQETALFREMNYLKFQANELRGQLTPQRVDPEAVAVVESLLARAQTIRNHIIKANMRLVISIVKKFVTAQQSFDDMLSDGTLTLMHAVDKFDYDRGFRFSTYAYRSIARSAYRLITTSQKEAARFTRDAEGWAFQQECERSSSSISEKVWSNLRELTASMLDQLDRRERFIIRSRYALGAHRRVRTFQCLADKLGVSKERVRQLEHRAVAKLRSMAGEFEMDELFAAEMV